MDNNQLLSHPVLQAMAFSFKRFNKTELSDIARQLGYKGNLENDLQQLIDAKIIARYVEKTFYSQSIRYIIIPKNWVAILRTINDAAIHEIKKSMHSNDKNFEDALTLTITVWKCVHNKPYADDCRKIRWIGIDYHCSDAYAFLCRAFTYKECIGLSIWFPKDILNKVFDCYLNYWSTLNFISDYATLEKVFFNNTALVKAERDMMRGKYMYFYEFLKTGRLDELRKKNAGNPIAPYFAALKMMHNQDYIGAYKEYQSILKSAKIKFFPDGLTNFLYALSMMQANTPMSCRSAGALYKMDAVKYNKKYLAMRVVLAQYLGLDDADEICSITNFDFIEDEMLAALFLNHFCNVTFRNPTISNALQALPNCQSNYLKLLFSFEFDELKDTNEQLRTQTGIDTPLFVEYKKIEKWEKVLDSILDDETSGSQTIKKNERIIYILDTKNEGITVKLQKSSDGINWTKGRNITLASLQDKQYDCMDDFDDKIAEIVKNENDYGWKTACYLDYDTAIKALVGCPRVFDENTGQRIDIVEEPLQIVVNQDKNGYKITTNAKYYEGYYQKISTICTGDKQITVVCANEQQIKTLETLKTIRRFPVKSREKLTKALEKLSGSLTVLSPLLKNSTVLKSVESSPLIAVQISPLTNSNEYRISLVAKPFGTCPPYQKPGHGISIVSTTIDGERVQTERDLNAETKNYQTVCQALNTLSEDGDDQWIADTGQCLEVLEAVRKMPDTAFVEWPQGVKMRVVRPMIEAKMLNIKINGVGQWFELEGELKIGDKEKLKMAQLLESLSNAEGNFIRLDGDEYIAISEQLRRQLQAIAQMAVGKGDDLKIAAINGVQLSTLGDLGAKIKADEQFKSLISRIKESEKVDFTIPSNIHAELRPYQQEGYKWMSRLAFWGAGACLADDMGLGKTIQAITVMQSRAALGPQLVIMPTNVLMNWQQELVRFAPALTVHNFNQGDRESIIESCDKGDVVISTYGLLVTEIELFTKKVWATIVLDEAHSIKNRDTQTSKGAMQLKGDFRLILTGTPLQNHLSEIWNLFQFANPGLLGTFQQFTDRFILPVERDHDTGRQKILKNILTPFILRRTKADVLNELPEKTEITLRIELSDEEKALYDNIRQTAIANLENDSKNSLRALAEITKLRQAACNPRLVNPKLKLQSSKMQAFLNLVAQLRQGGHRALVFSQFTSHLALVREELDKINAADQTSPLQYLYLDGSTSPQERNRLVKAFQTGDEPLFLISLKAGGVGLNLTAADYVIHLDPWWNPAIEDQASDRAHRIGQERPVTVYRLIAASTIEEKIIRLHQNKRSMADALLQDTDLFSAISAEDIIRLLRESVDSIK